jgi:hypothetical protein
MMTSADVRTRITDALAPDKVRHGVPIQRQRSKR